CGIEVPPAQRWMEPGLKQRLIRVDVPHTGNHALIEQHGLQGADGPGEALPPIRRLQVERLRPEPAGDKETVCVTLRTKQRRAAEPADIAEAELAGTVVQLEDQMRMSGYLLAGRHDG